jgi:hypothetical protein
VVFGKLLEGHQLLNKLENIAGSKTGDPAVPVTIEDCGELSDNATVVSEEPVQEEAV